MLVVKCSEIILNIFSTVFIPLFFLFLTIAPLQYAARSFPGDSFAVLVLVYSVGIAWYQCDGLFRSLFCKENTVNNGWEKLKEPKKDFSGMEVFGKYLCFVYKLISCTLAAMASHSALVLLRLSCPSMIPYKTIKACSTSECVSLYLFAIACYYWFIASHVITASFYCYTKLLSKITVTRNSIEEVEILENA